MQTRCVSSLPRFEDTLEEELQKDDAERGFYLM